MKLTLSYPIKPVIVTQRFGDTTFLQWYKDHGVVFTGHNGIDFWAYHGEPIYAAHDGMAFFQTDTSLGHGVVVITQTQLDYKNTQAYFKSIYWHMCDSIKEPKYKSPIEQYIGGIAVKTGDLIGYADSTGLSTGDHLHFGLKPMMLKYPNDYTLLEPNNGTNGAIDPSHYLPKHIFNLDINFGDHNDEVKALQDYLIMYGFMAPVVSAEYGWYGNKTATAVKSFQKRYQVASDLVLWWNAGKYVGIATRRALNA
jgi:hypothetical protein